MDWEKAIEHFYKVMNDHNERRNAAAATANAEADVNADTVAAAVAKASSVDFSSLLRRHGKGERTQELHDEMMAVV